MIVFDASTLVSAALKSAGVPERALLRAEEIDVLAFSVAVDLELSEVLNRPKNSQSDRLPHIVERFCDLRRASLMTAPVTSTAFRFVSLAHSERILCR